MDQEKKEVGGWWMWILMLTVVSIIVFTGLSYFGIIGKTIVERKVFENSYQYTAGQRQMIATYEAQLAELNTKLANPELDATTRSNMEGQVSAIRIQLAAARSQ